ncbi:N-formylglutamate amidohydrolase [Aliiglaciecola sp. CAU 1673]|uniref:N-formylglutamate amidohydrolase n=1 Tax=Aliiglaciecola sp. CAU 1673 TaxID=3032595 RepID=UPI0023DABD97|nr:N-formylglutamate amidohydrolase [Aliiglaciecola sp. CAU 1673]MDF2177037.1 N-formylglutamate amidohydrolase [Aliiglaciecola sp. CAU 1673]
MKKTSYCLQLPVATEIPLVFDSPHSGIQFPQDFRCQASLAALKTGWDAKVNELWEEVLEEGGTLLSALYSRMVIDLNRAPDDIDPDLLAAPWALCKPTKYSDRGMGLIRKLALPDVPMYDRPLEIEEVLQRLCEIYHPYHQVLKTRLDDLCQQFGAVWHVDCHSMKSTGNKMNVDAGERRADIVLGDNDGNCCEPGFVEMVKTSFESLGYVVALNKPYKGGYLVTHYGQPLLNRHSMQIEINRALYLDEAKFVTNDNYQSFKRDLGVVISNMATYVRAKVAAA